MDRTPRTAWTRRVRRIATVIVLGMIMSILDATVINVALHDLSRDFGVPLDDDPVDSDGIPARRRRDPAGHRLGLAQRRQQAALHHRDRALYDGLDPLRHCLVGRVADRLPRRPGIGGGLILPVGQMILVRASGPKALPRVMAAIGLPMVLAPVLGPTLGGLLLEHAGWRWIFFINVPIGVVAVIAARRMLPGDHGEDAGRLDLAGLMLAASGSSASPTASPRPARRRASPRRRSYCRCSTGLTLVAAFVGPRAADRLSAARRAAVPEPRLRMVAQSPASCWAPRSSAR